MEVVYQTPSAPSTQRLSVLQGPVDPPLIELTLGELLDVQCAHYGSKECLVIPWTGARWTYDDLDRQRILLARTLLSMGIRPGDRVGIMAGNCEQYVAVFFACATVGCILVILNNTYTASEAHYGLAFTECKLFFTTKTIGRLDNGPVLDLIKTAPADLHKLSEVIILRGDTSGYRSYANLVQIGERLPGDAVVKLSNRVSAHDVCNLQFTSGTTGHPKAAMLTHHNIVNNSRFIGDRMALTPDDVLCCPPPLFHCFGLVLGLLAIVTHGGTIVYPAEVFDGPASLEAISAEKCTAIHGVPAMFDTLFSLPTPPNFDCSRLRTGIIAGAPVPRYLMKLLLERFGMHEFTSSYGLTEASPTCFNAFVDDSIDTRLSTVGTLMPHARAKIVDHDGNIVPMGQRGELCIAGYQLQAGYWNNSEKTAEVMVRDKHGTLWLHTGDEAMFHDGGYCTITGRFKDIIIRGGENIYPLEIEERLMKHPAIERAIVAGIKNKRLGEVVGAFIGLKPGHDRMSDDEVRNWVREKLGRHKAPEHVFWLGKGGIPATVPITGSGKVRKFEMAKLAEQILAKQRSKL